MRTGLTVIVLMLLFAAPARATVIHVDTFVDPVNPMTCSLRDAIDTANGDAPVDTCEVGSGDDVIQLAAGAYSASNGAPGDNSNFTGDLDVLAGHGALTIAGAGAGATSISAAGDRVLDVIGGTVTLSGVTVTGAAPIGEDGGGIRNAGTLTLVDAAVIGSHAGAGSAGTSGSAAGAGGSGGGIFSSGPLTLVRTTVSDNVAGTGGAGHDTTGVNGGNAADGGPGGGIFATGTVTLDHSRILRNHAGAGGPGGDGSIGGAGGNGGSGGGLGTAGMLTMTSTLVADNAAGAGGVGGTADSGLGGEGGDGGDGGGLGAGATTSVAFSTFNANTAGPGGAGGLNVDLSFASPGAAGVGSAIAGQATLARTIATGTCSGALADGGSNLGGTGCPGSHAAPGLSAAGTPGAGSPAIDAAPVAGCPGTDLAGTARPQGVGCDIGAFEVAAGTLAFSPSALAFQSTRVGGVRRLSVTARNTGLPGLAFPAVDVTGAPHFRLGSMTCSAALLGGGSCAVTVAFTPKLAGARTGTLRIGAQSFPLSGKGVPVCVVPKLKGKTIKQARKKLQKAHCKLGKVVRRGHGRPGRVRSTKPKAGAKRPAGTRIRVVVNRGPAPG